MKITRVFQMAPKDRELALAEKLDAAFPDLVWEAAGMSPLHAAVRARARDYGEEVLWAVVWKAGGACLRTTGLDGRIHKWIRPTIEACMTARLNQEGPGGPPSEDWP